MGNDCRSSKEGWSQPKSVHYTKEFGKIEYIKTLRKYVREQVDALSKIPTTIA